MKNWRGWLGRVLKEEPGIDLVRFDLFFLNYAEEGAIGPNSIASHDLLDQHKCAGGYYLSYTGIKRAIKMAASMKKDDDFLIEYFLTSRNFRKVRSTTPRLAIQNWFTDNPDLQNQDSKQQQIYKELQRSLYLPLYGHWYENADGPEYNFLF